MTTADPAPTVDDAFADALVTYVATEIAPAGEPVAADTDLLMTGLVDSVGVVMIVGFIEDRLATTIDPGDVVLEHFQTVDAMVEYLRTR